MSNGNAGNSNPPQGNNQPHENHPQGNTNQPDRVSRDVVYSQMYEEGRYFRQHELTVSTWYSAFLIAIIAAIVVFKTSSTNDSFFYSEIRISLLIIVIFIGICSMYSVFYSGRRYTDIRQFLDGIEPDFSREIDLTSMTFNPRQMIIFILLTLTIVTSAIIVLA